MKTHGQTVSIQHQHYNLLGRSQLILAWIFTWQVKGTVTTGQQRRNWESFLLLSVGQPISGTNKEALSLKKERKRKWSGEWKQSIMVAQLCCLKEERQPQFKRTGGRLRGESHNSDLATNTCCTRCRLSITDKTWNLSLQKNENLSPSVAPWEPEDNWTRGEDPGHTRRNMNSGWIKKREKE